jgi:endonuclease-3
VVERLARVFPGATTELNFGNAFELLVATILSAQSTDRRVNEVTPALFAKYPDARSLAGADVPTLEREIVSTGFFRTKARSLVGMASRLVERHGGEVPSSMDALVELPGVGRKTANVVLGHALGIPGLPVDRHVLRVAQRIGIARGKTPEIVEQQLTVALPPAQWTLASDCLILHGRRVCRPTPLCDKCVLNDLCEYFRTASGTRARRSSPRRPATRAGAAGVERRAGARAGTRRRRS